MVIFQQHGEVSCMELPELDFLHFPPASTTRELRGFVHGMVSYQHDFDGVFMIFGEFKSSQHDFWWCFDGNLIQPYA